MVRRATAMRGSGKDAAEDGGHFGMSMSGIGQL